MTRMRREPAMRFSFRAEGFTLTELAVVMVVVTILSAFAISRINVTSFDTEGFANRAAAMVRYAQKIAISQRTTVAVVIVAGNPGNLQLCGQKKARCNQHSDPWPIPDQRGLFLSKKESARPCWAD